MHRLAFLAFIIGGFPLHCVQRTMSFFKGRSKMDSSTTGSTKARASSSGRYKYRLVGEVINKCISTGGYSVMIGTAVWHKCYYFSS